MGIDNWRNADGLVAGDENQRALLQDVRRLSEDYMGACKLVADMHMAAMGGVVGLVRGVVEDVQDLRLERDKLTGEAEVMRDLLRECHSVIRTIEPASTDEADMLARLLRDVEGAVAQNGGGEARSKSESHLPTG